MKVHTESIYGFYHGQDPRTFSPDKESCTEKELENHKQAVDLAHKGKWSGDDSGCHHTGAGSIICKTSMGIGVYSVIVSKDGDYIRDASYEDIQKESYEWEESNATP